MTPFKIFRKKAAPSTAPPGSATDRLCKVFAAPKRLLLVEDDEHVIEIVGCALENYAVDLVAVDGVKAARHELENDGDFEAAILDVRLVNGDGVTLYGEILERWPKTKVVFMTGYANETRARVEKIGPARVFDKITFLRPDFLTKLLAEIGLQPRSSCV